MKIFLVCYILGFLCIRVQGKCNPLCGTGVYTNAGACQSSGRCLCFWGWTGPNAVYTTDNKILADYCRIPCHFTGDYKNPKCATVNSNHTGGECRVPISSTAPGKSCDPKCGNHPNFGRGKCLRGGRCLCWWGWTGPNACYVEDGKYRNRIIADYCVNACHFTPYVRNPKCLNGSGDREDGTTTTEKPTTQKPTTVKPTAETPTTNKLTIEKPAAPKQATGKPTTEIPTTKSYWLSFRYLLLGAWQTS